MQIYIYKFTISLNRTNTTFKMNKNNTAKKFANFINNLLKTQRIFS